jgi:outer membrane cobalamin receptor
MKIFRNFVLALFFLALIIHPTVGKAQASFNLMDTIKIEEVVVTGTPVRVNRNNVPMAVSVINRAQIEETDESALLPVLERQGAGSYL